MTYWPVSYYEDIQGRLRAILTTVASQLASDTVQLVDEMIDANECGVALEIMSEMLVESAATVSEETFSEVESLVDKMGMDRINVDRLRPRIERGTNNRAPNQRP